MNLYLLQQYQFIQNLYQNESYIDILMNIDDFLDILNVYVFPNWKDAEIVDMKMLKHFVNITLKQPYEKMPHPKGGTILSKYDCIVKYKETTEWLPKEVNGLVDLTINKKNGKQAAKMEQHKIWLVNLMIPSRLLVNNDIYDLESIQEKLDDEEENNEELESIVDNQEDMAIDNSQNGQVQG